MEPHFTHPVVIEHILILEQYFKHQKAFLELLYEEPTDEFEQNSHLVLLQEATQAVDSLTEQLSQSCIKLAQIPYTDQRALY